MRYRVNDKGQIIYPARGITPPCPEGFHKVAERTCETDLTCADFEMKEYTCARGNKAPRPWCNKIGIWITKAWCLKCKRPDMFNPVSGS